MLLVIMICRKGKKIRSSEYENFQLSCCSHFVVKNADHKFCSRFLSLVIYEYYDVVSALYLVN